MTVEIAHQSCARLLREEAGVPARYQRAVVREIKNIWHRLVLHHAMIVWSVRGFAPHPATLALQEFLARHGTVRVQDWEAPKERWRSNGSYMAPPWKRRHRALWFWGTPP